MKYVCLVYLEEKLMEAMPEKEWLSLNGECRAYGDGLRARGQHLASEALQPVSTATTIRVRDGKLSTTDGPFAETKEQLGGFYLIDARDLNEAIQVAAKIPPARFGAIEIRPVRELPQV